MEPTLPKSEDPSRTNEFQKTKVNAENIFAQLELIRRKQVELTLEHINLALGEDSTSLLKDFTDQQESANKYKKNADIYAKKEADINRLISKVQDLGEEMATFHTMSKFTSYSVPVQNPNSNYFPKSSRGPSHSKGLSSRPSISASISESRASVRTNDGSIIARVDDTESVDNDTKTVFILGANKRSNTSSRPSATDASRSERRTSSIHTIPTSSVSENSMNTNQRPLSVVVTDPSDSPEDTPSKLRENI